MYVGPRLRKALSSLNRASSIKALRDRLADAALQMGFPFVALVQHGGLPRLVEHSMVVTNYPAEFVQSYIKKHYFINSSACFIAASVIFEPESNCAIS